MWWLISATSGIELTTCFKNMPMQNTIPENITPAKAIVKIVIIIVFFYLFDINKCYLEFYDCKGNDFLSNNVISWLEYCCCLYFF